MTMTAIATPTTPGSLGDQAMLDAATSHMIGAGGHAAVFPHAPRLRSNVRVFHGRDRMSVVVAMGRALLASNRVAFIGADVLDGVYHGPSSLKRLRSLRLAQRLGKRARVLGSSWSTTPAPEVIDFLRKAPDLEVLARDPISRERMQKDLGRDIRLVADLGFLLQPEARSPAARAAIGWAQSVRRNGGVVMGVNLSGHTIEKLPGQNITGFVTLISRWLDADDRRHIVMMPHDTRPGLRGDLTLLEDLAKALAPEYGARMHVPQGPLEAWDIKAMAGEIDLALTGRMHLAVACLGQGTPPVCIVYQGKFEGLMRHFGLENEGWTFSPETVGASAALEDCLNTVTARSAELRTRILAALPAVTALSRSNFDDF